MGKGTVLPHSHELKARAGKIHTTAMKENTSIHTQVKRGKRRVNNHLNTGCMGTAAV